MTSTTKTPSPARIKLLQAGATVFAREGLQGATTRMIAHEAGVNEVTLFRLFESKERLLAEVLANERQAQCDTLAEKTSWTEDLRADLRAHAHSFNAMLEKNEAMIRTLIGEARRQPAHAKQVIQESIRPARDGFIAYLTEARDQGRVRSDVKLAAAVDMFTGMLLSGMLRRTSHGISEYATKEYLETCVEIFVSGIAPPKGERRQMAGRQLQRAKARPTNPARSTNLHPAS
jgi:AcrR family transcriptional regulator